MRGIRLLSMACLAVLCCVQGAAASDADVIRKFGLLGRTARDCAAPNSEQNWHMIIAIAAGGKVTRTLKWPPNPDETFVIRNLRMTGPDVMQYDETGRQSELTVSVIRESKSKFRTWRSVRTSGPNKGEILVADGKGKEGRPSAVITLCGS